MQWSVAHGVDVVCSKLGGLQGETEEVGAMLGHGEVHDSLSPVEDQTSGTVMTIVTSP